MAFLGSSTVDTSYESTSGYKDTTTTQFSQELLDALDELALENVDVYNALISGSEYTTEALEGLSSLADSGSIDVDSIMAAAQQSSDQALGQNYQDLARSVGATDNSLVQAAQSQATTNAATTLAGTRAELEAESTQQQSDIYSELSDVAAQSDSTSLEALNSLLTILKGAETTEETDYGSTTLGVGTSTEIGI